MISGIGLKMSGVKLTYFSGRGYGERIRIILCASGIEFEEDFVEKRPREEFLKLAKDTPLIFGQVPLLEIDGLKLVQTGAIVRYLADRAGLAGNTPQDRVRIDILAEGCRDFQRAAFMSTGFFKTKEQCKQDAEKTHFKKYLPALEKVLSETNTGYLHGSSLSAADLALFEVLLFVDEMWTEQEGPLNEYPKLKEFLVNMKNNDRMKHYLQKYRKHDNFDEEYHENVKQLLAM